MSLDTNVCTFAGRLGRNPELKYTPAGQAVAKFSIAVNAPKDKTLWLEVTVWRQTAEFANNYLTKGSQVVVTGALDEDEWTGKDGEKRKKLVLNATNLQAVGSKAVRNEDQAEAPAPAAASDKEEEDPFADE